MRVMAGHDTGRGPAGAIRAMLDAMGKLAVTTGLVLLLGCSRGAGGAAEPASPEPAAAATDPAPGAGPQAPPAPLGEQECVALLDHYLDVAMRERRATQPPESVPTEAQVEEIRIALRQDGLETCLGAPRDGYDCAMQATTAADIARCIESEGPR